MKDIQEIIKDDRLMTVELEEVGRLDQALAELEDRMPDLFHGLMCPLDSGKCTCTYESGCKLMEKPKDIIELLNSLENDDDFA